MTSVLLLKDSPGGCGEERIDGDEFGSKEILFSIMNTNSHFPVYHVDNVIYFFHLSNSRDLCSPSTAATSMASPGFPELFIQPTTMLLADACEHCQRSALISLRM